LGLAVVPSRADTIVDQPDRALPAQSVMFTDNCTAIERRLIGRRQLPASWPTRRVRCSRGESRADHQIESLAFRLHSRPYGLCERSSH